MRFSGGSSGGAASPAVTFWSPTVPGSTGALAFATNPNTLNLWGIVLPCSVEFNKILQTIVGTDAVNHYDIGLYNYAGVLQASQGAAHVPSNGVQAFVMQNGPITLQPGRYYLASTGDATTASSRYINEANGLWSFCQLQDFGASTGGALPASITSPADSFGEANFPDFALTL